MIKEWTPYSSYGSANGFIIILDKEENIVLEYNPRIKSLAEYKFSGLEDELPEGWIENIHRG